MSEQDQAIQAAEACDRYLVGDRAGAAIASAVLVDYGIIRLDDKSYWTQKDS